MQANQTIDKSNLTTVMKRGEIGGQQRVFFFFFFLHTLESEYESTFTILGKYDVFCPCCISELPRKKKREASLSLYLDIIALVPGDSSGLSILFYSNLSSTWRVYKGSFFSCPNYKRKEFKKYEINIPKRSHYNYELPKKKKKNRSH